MLHHCGFFDPFIYKYKKLPAPDMLQIGPKSSPRAALEAFPDAQVDYCFSATWLAGAARNDVTDKINGIMDETRGNWHRFSISICDIDVGMNEDYLRDIYECVKRAGEVKNGR